MTKSEAIKAVKEVTSMSLQWSDRCFDALMMAIEALSAQGQESDLISREAAIAEFSCCELTPDGGVDANYVIDFLERLPPAQPEQRYTKEELRVFQHGISLSLLSKKSAQHWRYDEDTATEIEFLERLYEKVGADMRKGEGEKE